MTRLKDFIKNSNNKEDLLTHVQCVSQMSRTVGNKMSENFLELVPILRTFPGLLEEDQSVDIDNEITEASLIAISNLVKKCPLEAKSQIDKIFELVRGCISYDPNYNEDFENDEEMEANDDENAGWGSDYYNEDLDDEDDTAWKVRKSAVKVMESIIRSCSSQIHDGKYWEKFVQTLTGRFKERDDNVKLAVLEAFQHLYKAGIVQSSVSMEQATHLHLVRTHTSFLEQTNQHFSLIVKNLLKQLKSKSIQVKVSVMKTFSVLSYINRVSLEAHLSDLLPFIEHCLGENNNDYITYSLEVLKHAFKSGDNLQRSSTALTDSARISHFLSQLMGHHQAKIVSETLVVMGLFIT
jgi:cullin-associated NEDD8-dissociated protein 1